MHLAPRRATTATLRRTTLALVTAALLAGCTLTGGGEEPEAGGEVVVATHDSWNMKKSVLKAFTEQTGYTVKVQPVGDAGQLTNRLVLTKDDPVADLTYGIDNTFASRAADEGVLAEYTPEDNPGERFEPQDPDLAARVTPVDYSDVCVNIDDTWFAERDVEPPATLEDLVDPTYRDLFVTPAPSTSSPGLAFLLATIARFGEDGWPDYWRGLVDNGVKITSGWSDAYFVDFTAGGEKGDRPIVLSYASSPPFTIPEGADEPTTSALLDTCFRQVEYAAVLEGAGNPEGAQAFIDFMVGRRFQQALPDTMYVFPVDADVPLPAGWQEHAPVAERPFTVPEDRIAANRDRWLSAWNDIAG